MSKAKQIEEMQRDIAENTAIYDSDVAQDVAEILTYKGDRKADEVAEEIFAEIETSLMVESFYGGEVYYAIRANDYLHYKKKYTEGEG